MRVDLVADIEQQRSPRGSKSRYALQLGRLRRPGPGAASPVPLRGPGRPGQTQVDLVAALREIQAGHPRPGLQSTVYRP